LEEVLNWTFVFKMQPPILFASEKLYVCQIISFFRRTWT
jgi:hypothetical protein